MLLTKTRESKAPSTAKVSPLSFSLSRSSRDIDHLLSSLVEQCFSFGLWIESNNEQWSRSTRHGSVIRRHRTQYYIQTLGQSSGLFLASLSLPSPLYPFVLFLQKLSVQTVLNGSFPRGNEKQQSNSLLTGITRNGNSFNLLNQSSNHDSSLPFLNHSVGSPGTSARLHHTTVHHQQQQQQQHSHHHHHGAAAATARSLRREKTREGSLKSTSKDTETTTGAGNHHLFHPHSHAHHSGSSSIVSSSHQYSRSKSFFANTSTETINKPPNFPIKASGGSLHPHTHPEQKLTNLTFYPLAPPPLEPFSHHHSATRDSFRQRGGVSTFLNFFPLK